MKTSNRILFMTGIIIAGIVFALVLGSRIFLHSYKDSFEEGNSNYTKRETNIEEFRNFNSMDISGNWEVIVSKGDDFSVTVYTPPGLEDQYNIVRNEDTLFAEDKQILKSNKEFTLEIVMPEIQKINTSGETKLELIGFTGPELIINISGGAWITGSNCEFENLFLTSAGAVNLEFEETKTVNADVQLSGAGNLLFNMDGGILSGNAAGAVNIEYYGNAQQKIKAAGLVNISQRD